MALAIPRTSPAKTIFLQQGVIGGVLDRRSYMHSLIVKGIATKRIKGKSANLVNGEWLSAKPSPRKSKLLKPLLPQDTPASSPRGSTFRPSEPKTGRGSEATVQPQPQRLQPPDAAPSPDAAARKKSFRISLEPKPEDSTLREASFLFPGHKSDSSRLVQEARKVHRSPENSVFAQPPSRPGRLPEASVNPLAELGISEEVSQRLRGRGLTFRDHSVGSVLQSERESTRW